MGPGPATNVFVYETTSIAHDVDEGVVLAVAHGVAQAIDRGRESLQGVETVVVEFLNLVVELGALVQDLARRLELGIKRRARHLRHTVGH